MHLPEFVFIHDCSQHGVHRSKDTKYQGSAVLPVRTAVVIDHDHLSTEADSREKDSEAENEHFRKANSTCRYHGQPWLDVLERSSQHVADDDSTDTHNTSEVA